MYLILTLWLAQIGLAQDVDPSAEEVETAAVNAAEEGETVDVEEAEPEPEPEPEWEPRYPGELGPDYRHADLETLYAAKKFDEGLKAAKAKSAADPSDADLYWHVSRFMFEQGELIDKNSGVDKVAFYQEMVDTVDAGLAVDPKDAHLLFARGIGHGRLGTTKGVLSTLFLASSVEDDWLAAANSGFAYSSSDGSEIMPCDVYHALGIYYRLVPDSWIVQMIAGTRGSLEKSLSYTTKAVACAPKRIHSTKEKGVSQICKGTSEKDPALVEKGKATLATVANLPGSTTKDKLDKKHAAMIIEDTKMACGYSRDGQQDLDQAKLKK